MGQIDVMVVAKVYGSFQCEESELEGNLDEMRKELKTDGLELDAGEVKVGEAEIEIVGVADVHPETGDLTPRFILKMRISDN